MRILLVEDDTLIGDGIKAGLSKMGFSVDWFTEGRPGKEALYSAPYDAVILDLTLPGMDGRDILREWREKGKTGTGTDPDGARRVSRARRGATSGRR